MTSKQTTKTSKPAPEKASQASRSRAWRENNAEYLREYKKAYRQKQKATAKNKIATIQTLNEMIYEMSGTLNMQMLGVGSGIRDILEAVDRLEIAMHHLQNGPAIKAKSTEKMFK